MRAVTDVPGMPSAEELSALPHDELAVRLAEAYQLIGRLQARVEELERQVRQDSSTSSRPPSSDSPYRKKPRDRSLRERGKRRPGKQPGDPGTTMSLADDPDERQRTRQRIGPRLALDAVRRDEQQQRRRQLCKVECGE